MGVPATELFVGCTPERGPAMVRIVYLVGRPCTSPLCPAIWQCSPPPPRAPPAGAVMPVATRRPGWLRVGRLATPSFCPPGASGGGGGCVGCWRADQRIGGGEDVGRGRRRQRWWLLSTLATATAGLAGAGGWGGVGGGDGGVPDLGQASRLVAWAPPAAAIFVAALLVGLGV